MGKKRKRSRERSKEFNNLVLEKLRKLEKHCKRRRRKYSTDSDSYSGSDVDDRSENHQNTHQDSEACSNQEDQTEPSDQNAPVLSNDVEKNAENDEVAEVNHLDEEILMLLGDAPKDEAPVGKEVHADRASRLKDILENGLKKEVKDKLTEEYPIPSNCQYFKAPLLNAEVKAAVSDILQKKDASIAARQGQIGVALTALTTVIDMLVAEKSDGNQTILRHVSNACRLLCDCHNIDTKIRRNFLISTLNNKLKDTLKDSKRDSHLFGETLSEKLKASKAIAKTSQELRSYKPKTPANKTNPASSGQNLNSKHPQVTSQTNRKPTSTVQRSAGYNNNYASATNRNENNRKTRPSNAFRSSARYKSRRR